MKKLVAFILLFSSILIGGNNKDDVVVKITKDIPYIVVKDHGVDIKIQRIQDTSNKLTDDYAKTSRPCPPFCIPPIKNVPGVKTIAELELLDFIKNQVYGTHKGVLVDARLRGFYLLETIPGAINIPFPLVQVDDKKVIDGIFKALGVKINSDGSYDFSNAKNIAAFCSGLWCQQSTKFIHGMVKHGYPPEKILWYRDGFQAWKLLGLTTVVRKSKEVKK
jgi:rhodanese-related sulfurtransferase